MRIDALIAPPRAMSDLQKIITVLAIRHALTARPRRWRPSASVLDKLRASQALRCSTARGLNLIWAGMCHPGSAGIQFLEMPEILNTSRELGDQKREAFAHGGLRRSKTNCAYEAAGVGKMATSNDLPKRSDPLRTRWPHRTPEKRPTTFA
jgi:hypothetical protein